MVKQRRINIMDIKEQAIKVLVDDGMNIDEAWKYINTMDETYVSVNDQCIEIVNEYYSPCKSEGIYSGN